MAGRTNTALTALFMEVEQNKKRRGNPKGCVTVSSVANASRRNCQTTKLSPLHGGVNNANKFALRMSYCNVDILAAAYRTLGLPALPSNCWVQRGKSESTVSDATEYTAVTVLRCEDFVSELSLQLNNNTFRKVRPVFKPVNVMH